jgi:cytochrome c-type biogenesis protein CcmE
LKPKQQRLILGIVAIAAIVGAGFIALSALENKAAYFYSPSDVHVAKVVVGRAIKRDPDGVTVNFVVTDQQDQIPVLFKGITPDLFKEKSGVIAEGSMSADGRFIATNLLAKHDEKYMPPELSGKSAKTAKVGT